jgi:hypothetical protein
MTSFFLSFLLFFSWHLQPKKKQQICQNGNYQVALKNNKATVDNHQKVELITKLSSEISQGSRDGQGSPQQHSHQAHASRCQAPK